MNTQPSYHRRLPSPADRSSTLPPDREPSPARSGHQRETGIKSLTRSEQARTRCEPGTARGPVALAAFTLIEMLVVVSIMAILASLIFPVMGAIKKTQIRTRARGEMVQLETAIQAYKDKFGQFPPDSGPPYGTNQLYYELLGTTNVTLSPGPPRQYYYQTLDGSATVTPADISAFFGPNITGFLNCSLPSGGDEAPAGVSFFKGGLKPKQFVAIPIGTKTLYLLGTALDGPGMVTGANGIKINPWRYNSSSPTNNPKTFDLWIDVLVGDKTNRICNWSETPLVVGAP
jgi:prepilin-type N-terminal cleavage/methylation domain-containing protein